MREARHVRTAVTQFLDSLGVNYKLMSHEQKAFACEDVARERGLRLSQVVKCMVGHDPKGDIHVMLIPGNKVLKLKRAREVAGGIRINLVPPEQLEALGLIVGAISPTQLIGRAKFYIDNHLLREETVDI